jgi:hypothetical protein
MKAFPASEKSKLPQPHFEVLPPKMATELCCMYIAFFDNVAAGEIATRIHTDTRELLSHLFMSRAAHI